jgi:hypothetical protein
LLLLKACRRKQVAQAAGATVKSITGELAQAFVSVTNKAGAPTDSGKRTDPGKRIDHAAIDPVLSVETQKPTNEGFVLAAVSVAAPSVKLNAAGVKMKLLRFGPRGWGTVNEPEMLHSGGQAKPPVKEVNELPV